MRLRKVLIPIALFLLIFLVKPADQVKANCGPGDPSCCGTACCYGTCVVCKGYTCGYCSTSCGTGTQTCTSKDGCGTKVQTCTDYSGCAGTVQGYKVVMPGDQVIAPATSQTVSGAGISDSSSPYHLNNFPAGSNQSVSVTVPTGYTVVSTLCYNRIGCHTDSCAAGQPLCPDTDPRGCDPSCTGAPVSALGSSRTVNVPASGYADLWWHFTPATCTIAGTTPVPAYQQYVYGNTFSGGNDSSVYWSPTSAASWQTICNSSSGGCTNLQSFPPGNYYVVCDVRTGTGTGCSSNPFISYPFTSANGITYSYCGDQGKMTVCAYSSPDIPGLTSTPIPACGGPVTFTASESNFGVGCPSNNNRYYFLLTDNTNLALNTNSGWILSNIWKPTLVAGHSYTVSVQTNNGSASAAYTMPSFTVPGPTPPAQMTLVSPTDGAILTSPDVTLQAALPGNINWGQGCPTAPTYQFFVDTIQNNVRNLSGAFTYSGPNYYFAPAGLNYGTTYYWAVRACNGYSCGPLSAVWSFTIKNISPWWQTIEGDVYGLSVQSKIPSTCIPGNSCTPLIIRN